MTRQAPVQDALAGLRIGLIFQIGDKTDWMF